MAEPTVRGYLILTVEESSGKTQKGQFTWDTTAGAFEAFVKVEIRGGSRNVKAQTRKASLVGDTITWREELQLELLDTASELRLMLCREKFQGTKRGTSVIAACGIFVNDILEAVPIDKYFELFKPNAGGEGGYIRISMNFVKDLAEAKKLDTPPRSAPAQPAAPASPAVAPAPPASATAVASATSPAEPAVEPKEAAKAETKAPGQKKKGKGKAFLPVLLLAIGGVAAALLAKKNK